MRKVIFMCLAVCLIAGCSKPKITHIAPGDDTGRMTVEEVFKDKKIPDEQKIQIMYLKLAEQMERSKRAVETEKDKKLAAIIDRPVTPLRTPDTVLRVLMLPYEDSNGVLNSWKYSFIKVDDGKWVLSDYLNGTRPKAGHMLTPLDKNKK